MGLHIKGNETYVDCDGETSPGIKCNNSISNSECESLVSFLEHIINQGYVGNQKINEWFCPKCSQSRQQG